MCRSSRTSRDRPDATHTLAISAETNLPPEIVGDPQGDFVIGRGGPGRELVFSIGRDGTLEWSTTVGPDVTPVGVVLTSDEYLVVDYRNLKLLNQFLTDYSGQLLTAEQTGIGV